MWLYICSIKIPSCFYDFLITVVIALLRTPTPQICHLTLFGIPSSSLILSVFKTRAGRDGWVKGGGDTLTEKICPAWWKLFIDDPFCDDRLKHDRLVTLIKLFEYRDIQEPDLCHDNNILLQSPANNSCIQQFAWFTQIQACLI